MELLFDECVELARDDPEAYEAYRRKQIDKLIMRTNPQVQRRLKGIQFRIDMERRRSKTTMASCVKIFDMMIDHFYDEHLPVINGSLDDLGEFVPK